MTDIYQAIKADHDKARDLMAQIMDTSNEAVKTRTDMFEDFKLDLWAHHKIEEAVFFSTLRDARQTKADAHEALNEHHAANGLIEELDTMPKGNDAWIGKFAALKDMVEHHMQEEETEVFSEAKDVIKGEEAEELGDKFKSRKNVVVPALTPTE
jgi:hemerythrin-like domain-containing protein